MSCPSRNTAVTRSAVEDEFVYYISGADLSGGIVKLTGGGVEISSKTIVRATSLVLDEDGVFVPGSRMTVTGKALVHEVSNRWWGGDDFVDETPNVAVDDEHVYFGSSRIYKARK